MSGTYDPTDASDYQDALDAQAAQDPQAGTSAISPPPRNYTPTRAAQPAPAAPLPDKLDQNAQVYEPTPLPTPNAPLKDFAKQTYIAALGMGQGLLGFTSAAARALTSDPTVVSAIEEQKAHLAHYTAGWFDSLSPGAKQAMSASIWGGDVQAGRDVSVSHYLGAQVANLVPQVALAVLPGGIVGKIATKVLGSAVAGTAAGTATTGALFGAQGAGDFYNQLTDEVDKAKPEELMQSPVYAELRKQGMSDLDARKQLVATVAPHLAALSFGANAAAGAGLGGLLGHGAAGAAGGSLATRLALGAAEGAATMGGQSAADEAISQAGQQDIGTRQGYSASAIGAAGASGAAGGAILGGVGGLRTRARLPEVPQGLQTTPVGEAEQAALKAALPAQTGPQGEMFDPSTLGQAPTQGELQVDTPQGPPRGQGQLDLQQPQPGMQATGQGSLFPDAGTTREAPPPPPMPTRPPGPPAPAMGNLRGDQGELFPAQGPQPGMPGAAQPSLDLQQPGPAQPAPPPAPPTAAVTGSNRGDQGNLFAPAPKPGLPGAQQPELPLGQRPTPPRPVVGPAPPPINPTTPLLPTVGRREMIAALRAAGDTSKLAALKTDALRERYENIPSPTQARQVNAPAQPPVEAKAPRPVAPVEPNPPPRPGELPIPAEPPRTPAPAPEPVTEKAPAGAAAVEPAAAAPSTPVKGAAADAPINPMQAKLKALAAKRAAEKARMAATTVVEKPKVYVEPDTGEPKPRPGTVPTEDIRDAARYATGQLAGTKGEAKIALDKSLREIDEMFSGATHAPGAVEENLARWAGKSSEPIPGTKVRRAAVADSMLKLMRMSDLRELQKSRFAFEAVEEAHNKPAVYEAPEGEHALAERAVETKDAEPSARVTDAGNKEQHAQELLRAVLSGNKDIHEANAEYGEPGKGGRQRKNPRFADFLRSEIERAEDPAIANKLREMLTQSQERFVADKTSQTKSAETRFIEALLASTGKDYANRIRELLGQIEDPVGVAAAPNAGERAARLEYLKARTAARNAGQALERPAPAASSRFVDAALHTPINELLARRSQREGYTLHEALRDVVQGAGTDAGLRPARELAQRLLKTAPDVPVRAISGDGQPLGRANLDAAGRPTGVELNTGGDAGHHLTTLLHEALHTVTSRYIAHLPESHADTQALLAMRRELARHLGAQDTRVGSMLNSALRNPHELHAELMSNPELRRLAASVDASPEFTSRMAELGYPRQGPTRSVWRYFTDWVRRAVGLPRVASASEHSLLDHILQPLHDITNNAARYNARVKDPVVRGMAEPLLRVAPDVLREKGRDAWRWVDHLGVGDRARGATMAASPTDAMVDRYLDVFHPDAGRLTMDHNPLEGFRTAQEAVAHRNATYYAEHADDVKALAGRLDGPEKQALGELMNDATLAGVRLGDKADNSHLKTPEDAKNLADLQARYAKLSDDGRKTYDAVRNFYAKNYRTTRDAELRSLLHAFMPDLTDTQRAEVAKTLRSKASIEAFLKDSDNNPLAAMFGAEWNTNRKIVQGVAKVHAMGFVPGDYFPLRRFGDYVLRYGSKENGDYGVEMFEKRGDAERRRAELVKQGMGDNDLSAVMLKRQHYLRALMPDGAIPEELRQEMGKRADLDGHAEAVQELLKSILLEHATRSEAARTRQRRQGVQGASTDASRVLVRELLSTGGRLGALEHGAQRTQALSQMRLVAEDLENHPDGSSRAIIARQVIHEMEQRLAIGDNAASAMSGLFRRATGLGFVQSLMSPSHMLTSSIETHMNSASLLGARHGPRAALALTKALAQGSPTMFRQGARNTLAAMTGKLKAADWNLSHVIRDRYVAAGANAGQMTKLFGALDQAGLIDHTAIAELRRIAHPGGYDSTTVGTIWQRFIDFNAAGAHATDVANKSAVAKAAFDLELRKTNDVDAAVRYAVDTVRRAAPNYNLANKSRISTNAGPLGAFAGPLTQFKQYGLHMYSLMANLAKASMHGASAAERSEARKAFAGILGTHALMAGALTLIADPLRYVGGAYDWATGAHPQPHDYQNDVRGFIASVAGPELGEVISRGLPHAVGIDIHNRVGLANLLEVPELNSFKGADWLAALAKLATGASGEDLANMAAGASKLTQGDVWGGVQLLVPRVFRDMMKANDLSSVGLQTGAGKQILPADQISPWDVATRFVGFQPAKVSEAREGRAAVQEALREGQQQREALIKGWLAADGAGRAAIMADILQFNNQHITLPITGDLLMRELAKARATPTGKVAYGVRLPKGSVAGEAGAFANP